MKQRVIINTIKPCIDGGLYPVKRTTGEPLRVRAELVADGHDIVRGALIWNKVGERQRNRVIMNDIGNDWYEATFVANETGDYLYTVAAWIDPLMTWYKGFLAKSADGQFLGVELMIGVELLRETAALYNEHERQPLLNTAKVLGNPQKYSEALSVVQSQRFAELMRDYPYIRNATEHSPLRLFVQREEALFSTWYELFPRSTSPIIGRHGTLDDTRRLLPRIADMGFDILYLPPIQPIGYINRKGRNNNTHAEPDEVGCPFAIGSREGGHTAVHPALGTLEDFDNLVRDAGSLGIEVAMDVVFQCAPDHPYIKEHPQWFRWRPDGTIAYAENPPDRYEDVVPFDFECDDWRNLWEELKNTLVFWWRHGVRVFRVDNPHTKSFNFWQWCIAEMRRYDPQIIFLAEALTRPSVVKQLAKAGFDQSYTYFKWRVSRPELETYVNELTQSEMREYFRPNFMPNSHDNLPHHLQTNVKGVFHLRYVLAATLSASCGIYGAAFEHYEHRALKGREEYDDSEKYVIKHYDWQLENECTRLIKTVNALRKSNPALRTTWNIAFTPSSNAFLISYVKWSDDFANVIWCVVNLDPLNTQHGQVEVPAVIWEHSRFAKSFRLNDLLSGETYEWHKRSNYVEINPHKYPAHIFLLTPHDA